MTFSFLKVRETAAALKDGPLTFAEQTGEKAGLSAPGKS
jgi:hypothetical protein